MAAIAGAGVYNNGQTLDLVAPPAVVDLPDEYTFQRWTLNGVNYSGDATTSESFSTLDAANMAFVAEYDQRNYLPIVTTVSSLVDTSNPIGAGDLFGVTLTFDRAMRATPVPVLSLSSANATTVPTLSGGRWIDTQTWESGTLTFEAANSGDYTLSVSLAEGTDGRVMAPADLLNFSVDATPPAHPVVVQSGQTEASLTVSWAGYSAPADLYSFRVYIEDSTFDSVTAGGALSGVGAGVNQYTFTGLELDTDYFVAIVPTDVAGNAESSVTPLTVRIDSTLPPAVSVQLLPDESDRALLDWSGYSTAALIGFEGFRVYRETTPFADVSGLSPIATLDASAHQYRSDALDRSTTFYYAVVGYNRLDAQNPAVTAVQWSDPLAGNLSTDQTFGGPDEPIIDILSPLTITNGATLTVLPGTQLRFASGASLTVNAGRLLAVGTAFDPIRFTSAQDDGAAPLPAAGDWDGIVLADPAAISQLQHVWIQYGGGLAVSGADPVVDALAVVDNDGPGIQVSGGASFTATEVLFAFNASGLVAEEASTAATVSDSVFLNNSGFAAQAGAGAAITAQGNFWGSVDPAAIAAQVNGTVDSSGFLNTEPILGADFDLDLATLLTTNGRVPLILGALNASAYRVSEDSQLNGVPFANLHPAGTTRFFNYSGFGDDFQLSEGAGVKTLYAQLLNGAGNDSETLTLEVTLLADGPEITGFSLTEGATFTRPFTVNATASSPVGIRELRLEADGAALFTADNGTLIERWDISSLSNGTVRMRLVAEDASGNLATRSLNILLDPQPPAAPQISSPVNDAVVSTDTISVSERRSHWSLSLTVNGTAAASGTAAADGSFTFASVGVLEGSNNIVVSAYDAAGSQASEAVTVVGDTQSPIAPTLEAPLYDPDTGLLVQWNFDGLTGERLVSAKVFWAATSFNDVADALASSELTNDTSYAFEGQANGIYFFRVVGYDAAGNASVLSNEVSRNFDDTAPVLSIFYDRTMPIGSGDLKITLTANEPLKASPTLTIQPEGRRLPIAVPLTLSAPETWSATFAVNDASMESGEATVLVTARDLDSNLFADAPQGDALIVDLTRPTAILRTNVEAPLQVLNPEQIQLTLELSEPAKVGTTPSLIWSPPTGAEVAVTLSGAEDVWTGTLTLFPEMGKGDGLFLLEVFDSVDNRGTLITSGDEFEIYNTLLPDPPAAPEQLLAVSRSGGRIELAWSLVERAETYNVYRVPSSQGGEPNQLVAEGIATTSTIDCPGRRPVPLCRQSLAAWCGGRCLARIHSYFGSHATTTTGKSIRQLGCEWCSGRVRRTIRGRGACRLRAVPQRCGTGDEFGLGEPAA